MSDSQPVRGPVQPDDVRNYTAGAIWGEIVNALKSGWNHAAKLASTLQVTGAVTTNAGITNTTAGSINTQGPSAGFAFFDRAGAPGNDAVWYRDATNAKLNTSEGGDIWVVNATTGIITPSLQTPTFSGAWANFGGANGNAQYWKDIHGVVHLEGAIKSGVIPSSAFTLAAGYRPTAQRVFAIDSNDAFGEIIVKADGTVNVNVGNNTAVWLDGITFRTV